MTFGDLKSHVAMLLGENRTAPVFYSIAEIGDALNQSQRLFAFVTLCIHRDTTIPLADTVFYRPSAVVSDWILPLRLKDTTLASTPSQAKINPARLEDLPALNLWWTAEVGLPLRYVMLGSDLLVIWPKPGAPGGTVRAHYAAMPATMTQDADTPEVPTEYHGTLAEFAVVRLRCKEGGQEFAKEAGRTKHFFEDAKKLAVWVRGQYLGLGYDTAPSEEVITKIEETWLSA